MHKSFLVGGMEQLSCSKPSLSQWIHLKPASFLDLHSPRHVMQTAEDFIALSSSQTLNLMAGRLHKNCAALIPAHEKLSDRLSSQRNVVLHKTCLSGSGQTLSQGVHPFGDTGCSHLTFSYHGSITAQQPIKLENTKLESCSDRAGEDLPQQTGTVHSCCFLFCSGWVFPWL